MKRPSLSLLALSLTSAAFASDMFLPIPQGTLQAGASLDFTSVLDRYENDGTATDIEKAEGDGTFKHHTEFTPIISYGIIPNVDVTLRLPYVMYSGKNQWTKWSGDGLDRPIVTVKHGLPELGIAGFVNLYLPVGSDEIAGEEPLTELGLGVLMDRMSGFFQLRGDLTYFWARERKEEWTEYDAGVVIQHKKYDPANKFTIDLRPGYLVAPNMIAELDLRYWFKAKDDRDGKSVAFTDQNRLDIAPGLLYHVNAQTKVEILIPYTLSAKNCEGGWGVSLLGLHRF